MIDALFLSVGAMKAGTTWLYEQLRTHPGIHFTPEKELHYFANRAGVEDQTSRPKRLATLRRALGRMAARDAADLAGAAQELRWYADFVAPDEVDDDWYTSLFRDNPGRPWCADFSNLYCQMGPAGWDNVRRVARRVKVVYTLRDPLARVWSHYKFHMQWTQREDQALQLTSAQFAALLDKNWFWANARYAENLSRLRACVDAGDLLLLFFEDLRADPAGQLRRIQRFLGVAEHVPDPATLALRVNASREVEAPREWRAVMERKLAPEARALEAIGVWHPAWNRIPAVAGAGGD